jgi:predicted transcriptional regulator
MTKVMEHLTRRALVACIEREPGMRLGTLARDLSIDYKTALHHARVLAREGRLVVAREGRWRRCYLPGAGPDPALSPGRALGAPWSRSSFAR